MTKYHRLPVPMVRRLWHAAHVAATIAIPWVLVAYYFGSHRETIIDDAHIVAGYHMYLAISAGILMASALLLRLSGRQAAATLPFAVMWIVVIIYSTFQIDEFGGDFHCDADPCMPDFGLFLTAIPYALAVSCAVVGSAMINHPARRDSVTAAPS